MKMPDAQIREEILKRGAISFARFMELALYCPETGYYERKKDIVGTGGDFITSVSAGSLFGELLAFQLAEWLEGMRNAECGVRILEAGAHDGRLAADILNWLQAHRPGLFAEIEYVILEPSATRQAWQSETLKAFVPRVRWLKGFSDPAVQRFKGILLSNELLDAFPFHRLGWDAQSKTWFEWGVIWEKETFAWTRLPNPHPVPCDPQLEAVLPDGYTIEVSPAADAWWRDAANALEHGKLITIDYGYTAEEQFSPSRTRGTLRTYARHQVGDELLSNPGEQDLTAHINFSAIQEVGEECGLKTETFCAQPQFLTRILQRGVADGAFAQLSPKQIRQFQTLTHPNHLGRAFRVLVQSR